MFVLGIPIYCLISESKEKKKEMYEQKIEQEVIEKYNIDTPLYDSLENKNYYLNGKNN